MKWKAKKCLEKFFNAKKSTKGHLWAELDKELLMGGVGDGSVAPGTHYSTLAAYKF